MGVVHEDYKMLEIKCDEIRIDEERIKNLNNIFLQNNKELENGNEYFTKCNINLNNLNQRHDYFCKLINNYSIYNAGKIINGDIDKLLVMFDNFKNTSTAKEIKDLDDDIIKAKKRVIDIKADMLNLKDNISIEDILNTVVIGSISDIEQELLIINNNKKESLKIKEREVKKENRQEGIIENSEKSIKKSYSNLPAEVDTILDVNFNKRKTEIKSEKISIEGNMCDINKDIIKFNSLIKDLQRYKGLSDAINNFDDIDIRVTDIDIRVTTDKLKLDLEELNCSKADLEKLNNRTYMDLLKYNIDKKDKYKAIVDNMNVNSDGYNNQIKRFEKVQTYIEEQISHVQGYNERLQAEKATISRQIKDYLKDCIDEMAVLNKLGKANGETLFNIKIPNEEDINYSIIDNIVDEICKEKSINSIDLTVNFSLL